MVRNNKMPKLNFLNNVNTDLIENVIIFCLLVVIIVLLVRFYLKNQTKSSNNLPPLPPLSDSEPENDSDEELESFASENIKLVLYYAPWCPHCTSFMSEWNTLGSSRNVNGKTVLIEKVNCDENPKVAETENIEGYPTVKLHKNGESINYDGERSANALVLFLEKSC